MFGGAAGEDTAHFSAAGEVDALHLGRISQRAYHIAGICRCIGDEVDDAFREADFMNAS